MSSTFEKIIYVFLVLAATTFLTSTILFIIHNYGDKAECERKGGEMVGTGRYTSTVTMSGKVLVSSNTEIKECSK